MSPPDENSLIPLDSNILAKDLEGSLQNFSNLTLPQIFDQLKVLKPLAKDLVMRQLLDSVSFEASERDVLIQQLWKGLSLKPPASLDSGGQWLNDIPETMRGVMAERFRHLKIQKLTEQYYSDQVESYFLSRRADLEQIVYGVIRVESQGVAEELYLSLLEKEYEFGELAERFSVGDERYTHGLVGPMSVTQPHPQIRKALGNLKVGELHPPIRLDPWFLLIRLEHRLAARLDEPQRQKLLQELFEQDLDQRIDQQLDQFVENSASNKNQINS